MLIVGVLRPQGTCRTLRLPISRLALLVNYRFSSAAAVPLLTRSASASYCNIACSIAQWRLVLARTLLLQASSNTFSLNGFAFSVLGAIGHSLTGPAFAVPTHQLLPQPFPEAVRGDSDLPPQAIAGTLDPRLHLCRTQVGVDQHYYKQHQHRHIEHTQSAVLLTIPPLSQHLVS